MSTTGDRGNTNRTRIDGRQGGATHQESRDHNKHNDPGQSRQKPQKHSPAEEKR